MFDPPKIAAQPVLLPAFARLGIPMLVFGCVFLLSMTVMRVLLTPDRFPVRIGEKVVRFRELSDERQALTDKERALLAQQSELEAQTPSPVVAQVLSIMKDRPAIGSALMQIENARANFSLGSVEPVHIFSTSVKASGGTIILIGEARDVGDRSMQILAAFVDALRKAGSFSAVSEPEYVQSRHADGGTFSPFTISLTIVHGS